MKKAFFLDRDGLINVEVHYLNRPEDVILEQGVVEGLREIHRRGYLAVVVTNQAGVAKGLYPESAIAEVHRRISELLAREGEKIDAFYHCPHHPEVEGVCACRKPAPGMLLRAARELGIDPSRSAMIGDRLTDIGAGRAAGCKAVCLVRTGYGTREEGKPEAAGIPIADHLAAAVQLLLPQLGETP